MRIRRDQTARLPRLGVLVIALALLLGSPAQAGRQGADGEAPTPLGTEVGAGPLRLRVLDVVDGQAATDLVVAASATNSPPRDGITYVAVELRVRNAGEEGVVLDNDDFALFGVSGVVRRFVGAQPPEPALDGLLDPGASREGWVVLSAPTDETDLLLLFDSLTLPGDWADRVLALQEGATLPDVADPSGPNTVGTDPAAPADIGTPVVTAEWEVEVLEIVQGAAVFELVDYRTAALGIDDAIGADADGTVWVAVRLRVRYVGAGFGAAEMAYFPSNAFALADGNGDPIPDVLVLTPPRPDAAGGYAGAASREGWVAFDVVPASGYTLRFLPYGILAADPDPRYFAFPSTG